MQFLLGRGYQGIVMLDDIYLNPEMDRCCGMTSQIDCSTMCMRAMTCSVHACVFVHGWINNRLFTRAECALLHTRRCRRLHDAQCDVMCSARTQTHAQHGLRTIACWDVPHPDHLRARLCLCSTKSLNAGYSNCALTCQAMGFRGAARSVQVRPDGLRALRSGHGHAGLCLQRLLYLACTSHACAVAC
jgi:hypothetical protein